MEARFVSALQKVFSDADRFPEETDTLRLFRKERGSLQLCIRADADVELSVLLETKLPCTVYRVEEVYASLPIYPGTKRCTLLRDEPGYFPDLLRPFTGTLRLTGGKTAALWLETDPTGVEPGTYEVRVTLRNGEKTLTKTARVLVGETPLAAQTLLYTNWFHADCLADHYNVPVFSDDYWRITEAFMANAAKYGLNCILTPLFTPPLDTYVGGERTTVQLVDVTKKGYTYAFDFTLLDKWMALAEKHGITHFEFSHLFTQWGAKAAPKIMAHTANGYRRIFGWETDSLSQGYMSFLRQLGQALTAFCNGRGVTDRCLVHCSDEPGGEHIPRYRKCAAAVHEYFGAFRHMDALSDPVFYDEGLVQLPIPEEGSIEKFRGKVPDLWTYHCCGQFENELPNRFIAMPAIRLRILGALLYKFNCVGFLQWGFNFYNTQLSKARIDPFKETSANRAFPAGDAFIVYPGDDGTPWPSLREPVFFDALQDLRALTAAEQKIGRDAVLKLIADTLGDIDFRHYPMDEETFFAFRTKLFNAVEV